MKCGPINHSRLYSVNSDATEDIKTAEAGTTLDFAQVTTVNEWDTTQGCVAPESGLQDATGNNAKAWDDVIVAADTIIKIPVSASTRQMCL